MMHALVLEKDSASCNASSALLGALGYLVTPVFCAKKALLAARLMHFPLILIHTTAIPEDRRSLAGELKRCSPLSTVILLTEPGNPAEPDCGSVDAVLRRPLTAQALQDGLDRCLQRDAARIAGLGRQQERRQRSTS